MKYLRQNYGITYDFVIPDKQPGKLIHFFRVYISALLFRKKDSLIVIQKVCTERWYAKALKLLVKLQKTNTLYDLDDAEYLRQPTKTLHFFLRNCAAVSVGSSLLKNYCSNYNQNVFILTSAVPDHGIIKEQRNSKLTIGWVGNTGNGNLTAQDFSHKRSLFNTLFPVIKRLDLPCKLILLGVALKSDKFEIEEYFKDCWNIELEIPEGLTWEDDGWIYERIVEFDIGVAPMVDHEFNRAKSAFKVKQYLSCGIPSVASDIGENSKFIMKNLNGILCTSASDFFHAIEKISKMPGEDYRRMIYAAIDSRDKFSMELFSRTILDHFDKLEV